MLKRTRLNTEYSSAAIFVLPFVEDMRILLFGCQCFGLVPLVLDIVLFNFAHISRLLIEYLIK